ncbi:MAG TPA: M28 family peptidase [Gaiellaceae bacterium]|nr:M28 family peptidase [Gaiellaceae bacterium]
MAPPRSVPPAAGGRPQRPRRNPRRRSTDRPIDARTVRGAWLLVALPLLFAALTVARPEPLPAPALPAAFDGTTATALARDLAERFPDRRPGAPDALAAADWFREQLELYGFDPRVDAFRTEVPGEGRAELRNVVAVVPGRSPGAIVFLAHRDNSGVSPGANDNASGTAALIELARAYAPVAGPSGVRARPEHTLVFVSSDGGAYGALGAARFASRSPLAREAVAVVVLDAIAGAGRPRLVLDGDTARVADSTLVRTAAVRVLQETGREPGRPGFVRQLLDLGFPHTVREQGPLLAAAVPALTVTTVPDRQQSTVADTDLRPARLADVGRAAQALLASLDAGLELTEGTSAYVYLGRRTVRGWVIAFVLVAMLLPFVIGVVDLFARLRRRRVPLGAAVSGFRARLAFWGFVAGLLVAAGRLGLFPGTTPGRPLPPDLPGLEPPAAGVALLAGVIGLAWLFGRQGLVPRRRARPDEQLAGYCVPLLALALLALVVVATNPYALVFLLPSLYAWLWLPQAYDAPRIARVALLALGAVTPLLVLAAAGAPGALGAEAVWYVLSLVSTGYVSLISVAFAVVWLAAGAQLAAVVAGRYGAHGSAGLPRVSGRPRLRAVPDDDARALEG